MTPKQIREYTTENLIILYKNKARCFHSENKAKSIYNELEKRIGRDKLQSLRVETWHIQNGENDAMFNDECDSLIKYVSENKI